MNDERHVKIFRNGANQAVRIPKEFELPGSDAIIRKDGARLIIEPAPASTIAALRALTARWRREPPLDDLDDPWADIADPPPGPVDL
jgi:antitoxin VapB